MTAVIRESDLQAIAAFHAGTLSTEATCTLEDWALARDVEAGAVRKYARMMAMNALGLIEQRTEHEDVSELEAVPSVIAAAITCGFQVGVDAERRRRDAAELPR